MALEWTAGARSVLACDLQRIERHLHRSVGAVELGHRGLASERLPAAAEPGRMVGEQARRLNPRRQVSQREVIALLMPCLAHQLSRLVHRRLSDTERLSI